MKNSNPDSKPFQSIIGKGNVKYTDTSALYNIGPDVPENDPRHYVSMMTSISHTYGNVVAQAVKWVLNHFPPNTFKTIHTSTQLANTQLRHINQEILKKHKPMIVFRPRIGDWDEDKFLKGTPLIERQTDIVSSYGIGVMQPFINDETASFRATYLMNRSVITMDIAMIFETFMQQQDYVSYIQNCFRLGHPITIASILESVIPDDMIFMMGQIVGIPVYDDNGCTQEFFEYFNKRTIGSVISYRLQDSSGRKQFFRSYPANVEYTISGLSFDDGNKTNQVNTEYQISMNLRLEFNTVGLYYLYSDHMSQKFRDEMKENYEKFNSQNGTVKDEGQVIPYYVDTINLEDLNLPPGWAHYTRCSCILDKPMDSICIDSLMNNSLRKVFEYHRDNGLPISQFFDVRVRRQGDLLVHGKDYVYKYDREKNSSTIYFNNSSIAYTYTILIVVNGDYINDLIRVVYDI